MRKTKSKSHSGFTLLEVMVVAVIVLLMLGMALPVFRAITGSRSEAGATNHIAAMLGRARGDAIGLQKPIGVAFVTNSATQAQGMAEVYFPDCPSWSGLANYPVGSCVTTPNGTQSPYFYCILAQPAVGAAGAFPGSPYWKEVGGPPLEIMPDTDVLPLPAGVGVQTVCNCTVDGNGARTSDGYLNVGVVLFDGLGRMVSQNYGLSQYNKLGTSAGMTADYPSVIPNPGIQYPAASLSYGVPSQFGMVVFQREAFVSQNFSTNDPAYTTTNSGQTAAYTSTSSNYQSQETWLDQNATPLVIDRYTGTLIRAE